MTDTPFRPTHLADHLSDPAMRSRSAHNVVQMDRAQDVTAATAEFPICAELLSYWQNLRATRQMPTRREFDPRGIENALSCTFVAEKVAPSVARIRVAGSLLNEALGMEVRGMPITSLFDPCARDALAQATRDVFEDPSMRVLELSSRRGFNRKPMKARMLLLPMSDSFGSVSRLVGCLEILGGLGKSPRRFQINAMRHTTLKGDLPIPSLEDVPTPPTMRPKAPVPSYAFAEEAAQFQQAQSSHRQSAAQRNGLRLVVSND